MKNNKLILFFLVVGMFLFTGCPKPVKEMMITTGTVSDISLTSANVSGTISDIGEGVIQHGHCWSTTANPTVDVTTKTELGTASIGDFMSNLIGLTPNTKYFVRAYCSRGSDIACGNEISFATLAELTTTAITNITATTALSGGTIAAGGGAIITSRGVCWNTSPNPTTANNTAPSG
jgi:hypothetical protein